MYTAVGRGEGLDKTSADELIQAVTPFLPKLHSLVIGPGMGRDDSRVNSAVGNILQTARGRRLPLVLDADALSLITGDESPSDVGAILRGYPLGAITPNAYEFKRLCERVLKDGVNDLEGGGRGEEEEGAGSVLNGEAAVERLATKLGGVTVVRKGKVDIISNGTRTVSCAVPGGLKRCGGIGDVLSGAMGTMMAWVAIQGFEGDEVGGWVGGCMTRVISGSCLIVLSVFFAECVGVALGFTPHSTPWFEWRCNYNRVE